MKTAQVFAALTFVFALAVVFVLWSPDCSSAREMHIYHGTVQRSPDGTRVVFNVGSCFANPTARVQETDQEVRVKVTARGTDAGDCSDQVEIELDEPLGDRLFIDDYDGRVVEVALNPNMSNPIPSDH